MNFGLAAQGVTLSPEEVHDLLERLAELTHKINNPLTSLLGRAQLLRQRGNSDPYVVRAAEVIEDCSRRIADHLRELERRYKLLKEEHALLKKAIRFASDPKRKSSSSSKQTGASTRSRRCADSTE